MVKYQFAASYLPGKCTVAFVSMGGWGFLKFLSYPAVNHPGYSVTEYVPGYNVAFAVAIH